MERFHRYYRLHCILSLRRLPVPRVVLERELECTPATVMRVIEERRNYGAPVEYLREANGYRYNVPRARGDEPDQWLRASAGGGMNRCLIGRSSGWPSRCVAPGVRARRGLKLVGAGMA